jgi:hypothetical protein
MEARADLFAGGSRHALTRRVTPVPVPVEGVVARPAGEQVGEAQDRPSGRIEEVRIAPSSRLAQRLRLVAL